MFLQVRPSSASGNRLLALLPDHEMERIRNRLRHVNLPTRTELMAAYEPVEAVYFVEAGSVSMIATLDDGARIEVGLVGPEGMVGLPVFLGSNEANLEAMVQVPGSALRIGASEFHAMLADAPSLGPLLLRYLDAFHAQVSQTAACNGRHQVEQRLARWLLMTHDRAGGDGFPMTQEFLSTMLGVRRPGVTVAVGILQRAGLVCHSKGHMHVLDRAGLEAASCECYRVVRDRYGWLMGA